MPVVTQTKRRIAASATKQNQTLRKSNFVEKSELSREPLKTFKWRSVKKRQKSSDLVSSLVIKSVLVHLIMPVKVLLPKG